MAGLLDAITQFASSDEGMGLAQGLLSARGSQGMAAGVAGMQEARRYAEQKKMHDMQLQAMQLQLQNAQREASKAQQFDALARSSVRSPEMANAMSMGPMPDGSNMPQAQPGFDAKRFIEGGMAIDPMKAIAMQQAMAKESQFNKIDPKDFTPASIAKFSMTKSYGDLVPREKLHFADTGTQIQGLGEYTGQPVNSIAKTPVPDANKPFTGFDANGQPIPNTPYQQYEINKAGAGAARTKTDVNIAGPKAFEMELGKLDAEQLGKWRDGAASAQSTLGIVDNLRAAEKQGAYSGGGADAKLAVSSLINGITGSAPKGLVGSELYNSEANKLVLEKVKALGANPSNADREFIEKTVPRLSTSPQARAEMANFMEQKANQSISLYKNADSHARANSGLRGFDPMQFGQQAKPAELTVIRSGMYGGKRVVQYSDGSTEYAN